MSRHRIVRAMNYTDGMKTWQAVFNEKKCKISDFFLFIQQSTMSTMMFMVIQ